MHTLNVRRIICIQFIFFRENEFPLLFKCMILKNYDSFNFIEIIVATLSPSMAALTIPPA